MQPFKTADARTFGRSRTRDGSAANLAARRVGAAVVVAAGLAGVMLATAAPAAAINPGGGRHRVEAEREAQAAAQHATATKSAASSSSSGESTLDAELYRLRMCESHDNYRDNTGNGYYGAYQFAMRTWQDLGMTGRPDQASPAEQDYAAKVLHAHAGWNPWPACAQREHLR